MADDPLIQQLVEKALAANVDPEVVCRDFPRFAAQVRERWERCRAVEAQLEVMFPSGSSSGAVALQRNAELPRIPGYEVTAVLGRGGMGIVYQARHLKLKRPVALKMVLAGAYASPAEQARFMREAEAIAGLQHENIVQVYDVGEVDGRPYFTMELIAGGSLAGKLAGKPQPAHEAALLVATLAQTMHVAHRKGVIHRDLKPANILLTPEGKPKIGDFGLARRSDEDTQLTFAGMQMGTPSYMAPEQAQGKAQPGPAVDLYALGVILYEALTGRPPFQADSASEIVRQVISEEPVPPRRLNARVPQDLQTICLKCLEKTAERRYASAEDFAADLTRFLRGEPIRARPLGRAEIAWRWAKRNRSLATAVVATASLLVLLVVGSLAGTLYFRELASVQSKLTAAKESERQTAIQSEQNEVQLREAAESVSRELRHNLYLMEMNLAGRTSNSTAGISGVAKRLQPWDGDGVDLRNWEWFYLHSLGQRSLQSFSSTATAVRDVAWNPAGDRLASAGSDGSICVWSADGTAASLRLVGHQGEITAVTWSPDGQRLASASFDQSIRIWDAETGAELQACRGHTGEVFAVAWSRRGGLVASAGRDRSIRVWESESGAPRGVLHGHRDAIVGLAWNPLDDRLASSARDSTIRLWDVSAERETACYQEHTNWVNQIAWSPDGRYLASGSNDHTFKIWNAADGVVSLSVTGHKQGVKSITWSPDGKHLATAGDDHSIKVWTETGDEVSCLRGHTTPVSAVTWNPRSNRLATSAYDGTVKLWDPFAGDETLLPLHRDVPVVSVALGGREAKVLAVGYDDGLVQIWDIKRRKMHRVLQANERSILALAWEPNGNRLAAASRDGVIRLWNLGTDSPPLELAGHEGEALSVAWKPDGTQVASSGQDRTVRLWNAATGDAANVLRGHTHFVYAVAWSPNGERLASAAGDNLVKLWRAPTWTEDFDYRGHSSEVVTVAWSPDGRSLASAGYDGTVQLWDSETGHRRQSLEHVAHVGQVAWNQDGSRVASSCRDGTIKIWDVAVGKESLTLEGHTSHRNALAWSNDGQTLASGGEDRRVRIYDAAAGYIAARAPALLPELDRRLAAGEHASPADRLLRAEVRLRDRQWAAAGDDLRRHLLETGRPFYTTDSYLAGPFSSTTDVHESGLIQQTLDVNFPFSLSGRRGTSVWRLAPRNLDGFLDLARYCDRRSHVSAYVLCPIYAAEARSAAILVGSDDHIRLWLNGKSIYENVTSRHALPDQDAIPVNLQAGWNRLLVRVVNLTGEHALYVRISHTDEDLARAGGPPVDRLMGN